MDLQESKEIWSKGWPDTQKTQRKFDSAEWLIAEVEKLTMELDSAKRFNGVLMIAHEKIALKLRNDLREASSQHDRYVNPPECGSSSERLAQLKDLQPSSLK